MQVEVGDCVNKSIYADDSDWVAEDLYPDPARIYDGVFTFEGDSAVFVSGEVEVRYTRVEWLRLDCIGH